MLPLAVGTDRQIWIKLPDRNDDDGDPHADTVLRVPCGRAAYLVAKQLSLFCDTDQDNRGHDEHSASTVRPHGRTFGWGAHRSVG